MQCCLNRLSDAFYQHASKIVDNLKISSPLNEMNLKITNLNLNRVFKNFFINLFGKKLSAL
jgi:hypothetical protein